jgi:hypothetical protein
MKDFVKPNHPRGAINKAKVDKFIEKFNMELQRHTTEKLSYSLNTALDTIPELNDAEFFAASTQALKNGFSLTHHSDEHDTITYQLREL